MKKLAVLILCVFMALNYFGQNDKGKKVKTKFLALPGYDISTIDPSTVTAEFAAGESSFGAQKMKDIKTICKPKGGGLKDAMEISTYYYEVPFIQPVSYLIAKDGSGTVVYAEQVSNAETTNANFGYQQCQYWIADNMKKAWESEELSFKSETAKKAEADFHAKATDIARTNIYPSFMEEEFEVFTAKAKDYEYPKLDQAFEDAMAAYESMGENGPDRASIEKLKGAIVIWEKALESLDVEDKKSRINKDIAKGLYENLTNAYMYTYQTGSAIKAGMDGKKLYGNFSNNRSMALDARIQLLGTLQIASDRNSGIVNDPDKLNSIGKNAGAQSVYVTHSPKTEFTRLETEYRGFRSEVSAEKSAASKEIYDDAVASGEINPYDKYVTKGVTGKIIMMSPLMMAPRLSEFPKEICDITDLEQIMIMNNDIESVPDEIGNLSLLNKLDLSKNKITELPSAIGRLSNLKTLNISNNPITALPEEIKNCTSLKTINIKDTNISADEQRKLSEWFPDAKIKM